MSRDHRSNGAATSADLNAADLSAETDPQQNAGTEVPEASGAADAAGGPPAEEPAADPGRGSVADAKAAEARAAEARGAEDKATDADGSGTSAGSAGTSGAGAEVRALRIELDERVRDLQRVTAEYANYRKRVDRDRALVVEQATGNVILALLPVLDDLDRAREHGDLTGPFATMAEQLTTTLAKFGLTDFGAQGDEFDPTRHEAVAHSTSADVTEPTCVAVLRRGYQLGERLLRPAMVAVADPE